MNTTLRLLAFSDHHGRHSELAERLIADLEPDWIVLTGDMLPDYTNFRSKADRLQAQQDHWKSVKYRFLREGSVTTYLLGNHELVGFIDRDLRRVPPALANKVGFLEGVPSEFGAWGFSREYKGDELEAELAGIGDPPIILSHCPPYGALDWTHNAESIGHRPLGERIARGSGTRLVICGHIHEAFGSQEVNGTLVLNVAVGYAMVELDLATLQPRLLKQDTMMGYKGQLALDEE